MPCELKNKQVPLIEFLEDGVFHLAIGALGIDSLKGLSGCVFIIIGQGEDRIEGILSPGSMRSYPFLDGLQEDF